jgi:hypothetical protein
MSSIFLLLADLHNLRSFPNMRARTLFLELLCLCSLWAQSKVSIAGEWFRFAQSSKQDPFNSSGTEAATKGSKRNLDC